MREILEVWLIPAGAGTLGERQQGAPGENDQRQNQLLSEAPNLSSE